MPWCPPPAVSPCGTVVNGARGGMMDEWKFYGIVPYTDGLVHSAACCCTLLYTVAN